LQEHRAAVLLQANDDGDLISMTNENRMALEAITKAGKKRAQKRPGPGMPSVSGTYGAGKSASLVVRVGDERKAKLEAVARQRSVSPSDLVREFIDSL
jgi:hypothetical protein